VIWKWIEENVEPGEKIFSFMYQGFLAALREACGIAKVNVDDGTIGTHSLRRGG
jgi:hypothetical protein